MSKLRKRDLSHREEVRLFKELRELHAWSLYETGSISMLRKRYDCDDPQQFLMGIDDPKRALRGKIDAIERLEADLWEVVDE